MAVHSDTFGGLHLTGEDAEKFRRQVRYGRPSAGAKAAVERGRALAAALIANGEVRIDKSAA